MIITKKVIGSKENKNVFSTVNKAKSFYDVKKLLGSSKKVEKGLKRGYLTGIMYLSPQKSSNVMNSCPMASKGCIASCLRTAGNLMYKSNIASSMRKTKMLKEQKELFMQGVYYEIEMLKIEAFQEGLIPTVRLNGTSDIIFQALKFKSFGINNGLSIYESQPNVQFYEYTKNAQLFNKPFQSKKPKNLHLTFSRDENTDKKAEQLLENGFNVAYVFRTDKHIPNIPKTWNGYDVLDGDETDLRFEDTKNKNGKGSIIGLKAKQKAKTDRSGFVIRLSDLSKEELSEKATF